jgi:MFS family permease
MTFNPSDKMRKILIALSAGILGNLLSFLSSLLTPMHPQVSLDFSHLATFITAIALGPFYGLIAGAVGSIYPYMHYAVFGIYGPFWGLAIIFGKAMTGFICGLLRNKMPVFLAVNISYIPESLFTFGFIQFMSFILAPGLIDGKIISGIIIEGWVEVIIFSFLIDTVMRQKIIETAVLMLEIFIIMFLVHKEFIDTLLILLLITLMTMILFEIIKPFVKKSSGSG